MLLYQESLAKRKPPLNLEKEDLPLFKNALVRKIQATQLLLLKNAKINDHSIIYTGSKIIEESFIEPSRADVFKNKVKLYKFLFKHNFIRKKLKLNEKIIWFTDSWSKEYFHWMTDALTRLYAVKDEAMKTTVLLPEEYAKVDYIQRSLKAFRINKIVYLPKRTVAVINELLLPTHTAPTGNYNEVVLRGLRGLYQNFYKENATNFGDKIYISRSKALRRKVVNEGEVVATIEKYGFKALAFEDYNFEEQLSIIANAKYLISNHGAGLTNMLFMKEGGSILELRRDGDDHNNCYFSMASALDLKYYYQTCVSENNDTDTYTANLIVDINLLEKNLQKIV